MASGRHSSFCYKRFKARHTLHLNVGDYLFAIGAPTEWRGNVPAHFVLRKCSMDTCTPGFPVAPQQANGGGSSARFHNNSGTPASCSDNNAMRDLPPWINRTGLPICRRWRPRFEVPTRRHKKPIRTRIAPCSNQRCRSPRIWSRVTGLHARSAARVSAIMSRSWSRGGVLTNTSIVI